MTAPADIMDDLEAVLPLFSKVGEAANVLRLSPRHVRRLLTCGELRGLQHKPGGPLLIPKRALLDYIEARLGVER